MKQAKLIFGLLAVLFGAFIIWQMNDLQSKAEAASSWPHVVGTITTSELDYEKDAKILYRYAVDGQEYEARKLFFGVISNGDIYLNDGSTLSDGGLVARFPAGANVPVYFDPEDPSSAVLLPEAKHQTGMMKLIFGYGFIAGGLLLAASAFLGGPARGPVNLLHVFLRILVGGGMLAIGIGIIWYMSNIRTEARMARLWPAVTGTVTLADVWGDHPEIAYSYPVDGNTYHSDQINIGLASGRLTLEDGTEMWPRQLDRRFKLGELVDVFVDPDDPTNAVLLPDAKHNTEVPIYLGYAFAIMGPLVALFGKFGDRKLPRNAPKPVDRPVQIRRRGHGPKRRGV